MLSAPFNAPCGPATAGPAAGAILSGSTLPWRFERPHPLSPPALDSAAAGSGETLATIAGVLATVSLGVAARQSRMRRRTMRKTRRGQAKRDVEVRPFKDMAPPKDLYELLRIPSSANTRTIKQAYYKMQKICHPDVAGPEGEEMCILLNDAYDVLSNPQSRTAYDRELGKSEEVQEVSTDLSPTWAWRAKEHKRKPVWTGQPRSRSRWAKVKPEDRGPKHAEQKFVFVDEWACISCRNCCDVSPHTFCIDAEHGRARVYTQWGNSEEYLDYAVASCPVDCIHWVSREELQVLEHVTAEKMYDAKGSLPCPMAIMQGLNISHVDDPFELASEFTRRMNMEREMKEKSGHNRALQAASDKFKNRIMEAFRHLSEALRVAGWGA